MAGQLGAALYYNLTSLAGALPQSASNGATCLGTLNTPPLEPFLAENYMSTTYPWGSLTAADSCPGTAPTTNIVRHYEFCVSRGTLAPDGVPIPVMFINGAYPGPTIEANWGDWIEVNVHNAIEGPEEGTAIHWHGIDQRGTPWFDGVPTVGQCPIVPGQNLTYKFRADQAGTTWYHSHFSSQYSSGVQGAIVIHGPTSAPYDIDLGPILLADWYHDDYEDIVAKVQSPAFQRGYRPYSDSTLINGKGIYPCANTTATGNCDPTGGVNDHDNGTCTVAPSCSLAGLSEFKFTAGKKHLLRLINTGSELFTFFQIDNHTMTVVANDFTPVVPYKTYFVTLSVGQRTDVIVEATGNPSQSYWMRSTASTTCTDTNNPDGRAIIFYGNAPTSVLPTTTGLPLPPNIGCTNDALTLTVPACAVTADPNPATTFSVNITFAPNATGTNLWAFNNVTFEGDYNEPIFLQAATGNLSFPTTRNVYNHGTNASVRLIVNNNFLADHPLHLHGHDFQVLATGNGTWDGHIVNPANPQRRDVQQVAANGSPTNPQFIVLQWEQDNPGVWPFHCHVAWHLSGGLYLNVLERPADVAKLQVPQQVLDTCPAWNVWEQTHVVDQLDSGVKKFKKRAPFS